MHASLSTTLAMATLNFAICTGAAHALTLIETGGTFRQGDINLALQTSGGVAFATDLLNFDGFGVHAIADLNDGVYGNSSSWIGNSAGEAGVLLAAPSTIASFAFGRDNTIGSAGNPPFSDRAAGFYAFSYTTDLNLTPGTVNSANWIEFGTLDYDLGVIAPPTRRNLFSLGTTLTGVTAFRISVPNGNAIDEIELYSSDFTAPSDFTYINYSYFNGESRATSANLDDSVLTLAIASGTATQSGIISGNGTVLKYGAGTLVFSGANTHSGDTVIADGTLVIAAGSSLAENSFIKLGTEGSTGILDLTAQSGYTFTPGQTLGGEGTILLGEDKTLVVAGNFLPGNDIGLIEISGNLTLEETSTTQLEIGGRDRGFTYDAIDVVGNLTTSGTLNVFLVNGFTPLLGDSFQFFTESSFGSGFSRLELPTLAPGLVWDTSNLFDQGFISVAAIPEPSAFAALAGLATLGLAATRRRRRV